jgi:hypothetical protein
MSEPTSGRWMVPRGSVLPPPRPGVRHVHAARFGIVIADDALRERVNRFFHWPMILLALLVIPLLAIELLVLDRSPEAERGALGWLCWIGFGIISFAFLAEFIIKVAIAECRIEYCRRNWLDIVIIVFPLLRPLRLTSLVRTSRLFRLRGIGMKAARCLFALVAGLDAAEPWLQRLGVKRASGEKPPDRMTRHELMDEVKRLRRVRDAWEVWHQAEQEFAASRGLEHSRPAAPREDPAPKPGAAVPARREAAAPPQTLAS